MVKRHGYLRSLNYCFYLWLIFTSVRKTMANKSCHCFNHTLKWQQTVIKSFCFKNFLGKFKWVVVKFLVATGFSFSTINFLQPCLTYAYYETCNSFFKQCDNNSLANHKTTILQVIFTNKLLLTALSIFFFQLQLKIHLR